MRSLPRAQAMVEFALVLPILLLILMGIFDFGRAVYAISSLGNAAREGSRTAIVNQTYADIRTRASAQATALGIPTSDPGCPIPPSSTNLPTSPSGTCVELLTPDLSADCSADPSIGCVAVVTVKYTFSPITPIVSAIVPPIALSSTSREPIESTCTGAGCPIP